MQPPSLAAVVLAAGLGKRFRSQVPKVLHQAAGHPLVYYVMKALRSVDGLDKTIVVVGPRADQVTKAVRDVAPVAVFVDQREQLGTAHAVLCCRPHLEDFEGDVIVLPGDTPLLTSRSVERLVDEHRRSGADATLLTTELADPTGYGRIVRRPDGSFEKIIEEADADEDQRTIREVSTGVWCFRARPLFRALGQVGRDNVQGEYYLPDAAWYLAAEGGMMYTVEADDPREVMGVNDRGQLAEAAREIRIRVIEKLSASGVTFEDPATTYIDEGVEIGSDTVIRPSTYLEGGTKIGSGCSIGPVTRIVESAVGDRSEVTFSVVRESAIGSDCSIGPYANIRPGTQLADGAKAGAFVEIKASRVGEGSKVPHLSYVGDADIGANVNLGAGTITANYDCETEVKSKTVVGDDACIGSDTILIAPVEVGRGGVTAAGAVVTKDVGEEEVVAGVPATVKRKRKPRGKNK